MKTKKISFPQESSLSGRRTFLKKSLIIGTGAGISTVYLTGCSKEAGEEVTPAEDLMREHGLLNRVLLIYDHIRKQLVEKGQFPNDALKESAGIIRSFIEDYHEKLEEDFLFPRFEEAGMLTDLVAVLKKQHDAGRNLTDQIIGMTEPGNAGNPEELQKLASLLDSFNYMYRPHEAREDTVLFPAIRDIIKGRYYLELGEQFEDKEHELFGEKGFEGMVEKVAGIEKRLGIYDLILFTPVV